MFTSVWRQVEETNFSLADHESVGEEKKRGPGFHVNTMAAPISFKLILLGAGLGAGLEGGLANGTCQAGLLCSDRHRRGSAKRHSSFAFFCYSTGDKMFSNIKS